MTAVIRESVERYVINGTRSDDKMFMSTLTNVFTNLASKESFINLETKVLIEIRKQNLSCFCS